MSNIPMQIGQNSVLNLAGMYQQAQQAKMNERVMDMRERQFDHQQQQWQTEQQQAEMQKAREQMGMIAKLTTGVSDERSYQERLAAARAYGIDVSGAPQSYDPAWVRSQNIIATTFLNSPEKLTTTAQQLVEAGYQPGTPEFQQKMAQLIDMDASKVVSTTAGGMAGMVRPGGGYEPFILPNPGNAPAGAPAGGKQVVRTGKDASGRQVVQYSDGTIEYAGGSGGNAGGGFPGY